MIGQIRAVGIYTAAALTPVVLCCLVSCFGGEKVPPQRQVAMRGAVPAPRENVPIIRPGDTLEVFVIEDESFSGKYKVRGGGDIIFPRVGRVNVGGLTVYEAEEAARQAFEVNQLRKATVLLDIVQHAPQEQKARGGVRVYMSGSVSRRGQVIVPFIQGNVPTVYQAILHAGGFSRFADEKDVYVLRRARGGMHARIDVNIRDVTRGRAADLQLVDGDIVVVPEKRFGF